MKSALAISLTVMLQLSHNKMEIQSIKKTKRFTSSQVWPLHIDKLSINDTAAT
jgi:hypothetical protein